ncbi:MAG: hypothetical protein KGL43_17255 [Burkholderiales bacterium]|nr:hypothetical protein [Burkholderiales bacterium]
MRDPRWRQVLWNACRFPSESRLTMTEALAISTVNQLAGAAISQLIPTNIHCLNQMASSSASKNAGSV